MNLLVITGNLTRDPEIRTNQDGKTVCNFTVAVNRRRTQQNQQPEADFFRIAAWGKLGENCQKFLSKGRKVSVIGSVSVHTYQAQDGTTRASMEVFAQDVEFINSNNAGGQQGTPSGDVQPNMTPVNLGDGELPF